MGNTSFRGSEANGYIKCAFNTWIKIFWIFQLTSGIYGCHLKCCFLPLHVLKALYSSCLQLLLVSFFASSFFFSNKTLRRSRVGFIVRLWVIISTGKHHVSSSGWIWADANNHVHLAAIQDHTITLPYCVWQLMSAIDNELFLLYNFLFQLF